MQAARQGQQGQQGQQQPGRQQFAPPASYENGAGGEAGGSQQGTPAWARPQAASQELQPRQQQQRWQEQGGEQDGSAAPQRKQHSGPAPKTPGYHVAYVGAWVGAQRLSGHHGWHNWGRVFASTASCSPAEAGKWV